MTSPFDQAIADADETIFDLVGVDVLYTRGLESIEISAVPGQTTLEGSSDFGLAAIHHTRDYLVRGVDLTSLDPAEPKVGDRITEGDRTFEILSPGADMPAWRWSDASHTVLRIHTKLVSEEAA